MRKVLGTCALHKPQRKNLDVVTTLGETVESGVSASDADQPLWP
jgi:hypothetical protein